MFYQHPSFHTVIEGKPVSALVSLTPAESKRLIAKAVAQLPEVRKALEKGIVIIARGTTNAFVAEEIVGVPVVPKVDYTLGCIFDGELSVNLAPSRFTAFVLKDGKPVEMLPSQALQEFGPDDVFIKGANAVDMSGNAGILAAGDTAATIGDAWPVLTARGSHLIIAVGLEKLIPSVVEAASKCGIFRFKYATGVPAALVPLSNAKVVTDIQAFQVLAGVSATHVASGGIGGSEGTVVLSLEGSEQGIEEAFNLVKGIKGESAVPRPSASYPSAATLGYDALAVWKARHTAPRLHEAPPS